MIFIRNTLSVLIAVFLLSVLVRLPELNRPLSKHHEFCTATALRILQVWYDGGMATVGYNPAMNYGNDADKFINNFANASGEMLDAKGNYYYVSHPPLAYYFPYLIFKVLHVRPNVLPLQLINLFFHFVCGLFVYFTVSLLCLNHARSRLHWSSLVAYVVYIFSPATLWFQSNVYMSDMAVQLPFVIGVYTVLKLIIRQKFYSPKYLFFYSLVLFLMIYTSWLGVFFAIGVFIYSLLHVQAIKGFRVLIFLTVVLTFLTLQFVTFQYAQINGPTAYIHEAINRYLLRGSLSQIHKGYFAFLFSYIVLLKDLILNYLINYLTVYLLIGGFIWLSASKAKMKIVFSENGYRFIWLSVLPVVLLHLLFLNYSAQDFTTLYGSLFFSVLMGILYDKVKKSGAIPLAQLNRIAFGAVFLLLLQYYIVNPPGSRSIKGDEYALQQRAGKAIAAESHADEIIFVSGKETDPQLVFYAQRNLKEVANRDEAIAFMDARKWSRGIWFDYSDKGAVFKERLRRQQL